MTIIEELKELKHQSKATYKEICEATGLKYNTVYSMFNRNRNITYSTVVKMLKFFGKKLVIKK